MRFLIHADPEAIAHGLVWARPLQASVVLVQSQELGGAPSRQAWREAGIEPELIQRKSDWLTAVRVVTRAQKFDLAVVGALWRKGLRGALWSAAPDALLRLGTNLLLARGEQPLPPHRILAAIGTGPARGAVLGWAIHLAGAFGAPVSLVHVVAAAPQVYAQWFHLDESRDQFLAAHTLEARAITESLERLRAAGIAAEFRLRRGEVEDEILAEAKSGAYDLLILGSSYAAGARARFLMENVMDKIVQHAHAPVLLVRQP